MKKYIKITTNIVLFFILMYVTIKAAPDFNITTLNNPAPGVLSFNNGTMYDFQLVDNYGYNIAKKSSLDGPPLNKKLKNGLWISLKGNKYYLINDYGIKVDSIPNPTAYTLDFHDVILLSNGNYLILLTETVVKDLSNTIEGGNTKANLYVNVLVETDRTGQIFWQWNMVNHIEITDVVDDIDLRDNFIDLTHINSLYEDKDGNIIVSIRNFDEVAKINKSTGAFIWRMGGSKSKKNQFTFTNDTENGFYGFSHQHTVSILENGNILMFDNGNLKNPQYSRAIEYSINTTQKTATKVWEYRPTPDLYSSAMGSVERLPNGNTLINWATKIIQEIKPDKSIALEMKFDDNHIYRVQKVYSNVSVVTKKIIDNIQYDFMNENNQTGAQIAVNSRNGDGYLNVQKYDYSPVSAEFSDSYFTSVFPYRWVLSSSSLTDIVGKIYFNSKDISGLSNLRLITIYKRSKEATGTFVPLNTIYDNYSGEISADFTGMGEFILVSNKLDKPLLINPINNIVSKPNGKLEWEKTIGVTNYQIQLDNSKSFSKPIYNIISADQNTFYNYKNLLKIDSCFWRVRALNKKDTSEWSEIGRFTTVLPVPKQISPFKDSLNIVLTTTLDCFSINEASSYIFELANNTEFIKPIFNKLVVDNSVSISTLDYDTEYFWRVKAVRSTDSSNWSSVWRFRTILKSPELQLPEKKASQVAVNANLTWKSTTIDSTFHLQVALNNSFTNIILDTINLKSENFRFIEIKPNTTYFWRVMLVNGNKYSDWSNTWSFTTGEGFQLVKPILISPKNNSENYIIGNLKWSKVINANKYQVQLANAINKSDLVIDTVISNIYELNYKNLNYNSKYVWRIKALSNYSESNWSDYWNLNTAPKSDKIVLIQPQNDAIQTPVNLKFEWFEVTGIDYYTLQIAEDSEFKNLVLNTTNIKANFYYFPNLQKITKYFWRVKYVDGVTETKWSDVWYFVTETDKSLASPELLSPIDNEIAINIDCSLEWMPVPNANNYKLSISEFEDFSTILVANDSITDTNLLVKGLEFNQRYFWRTSASNEDSQCNWSETRTFITELKQPIFTFPSQNSIISANNAEFKWIPSEYNEYFTLQISTNKDFMIYVTEILDIKDDNITLDLNSSMHYYFRIKAFGDGNESDWTEVLEFDTKSGTSVQSEALINQSEIYPNPCIDELFLNKNELSNEIYLVYDLNGNLISKGIIEANRINIQEIQNGSYNLLIKNKNYKFVKIK